MTLELCPRCQNLSLERYKTYSTCLECQYADEFDSTRDEDKDAAIPKWAVDALKNDPCSYEKLENLINKPTDESTSQEEEDHA